MSRGPADATPVATDAGTTVAASTEGQQQQPQQQQNNGAEQQVNDIESNLFRNLTAWFSSSVPGTAVDLWKQHGGLVDTNSDTARFLFSQNLNEADTKDLGVPVYLPSFVNDCVIEGHYITSLGRYLATHGGDSEGVTIPAPVPAPAEQAAPRKGRRIRRAQFTPADVQITAGVSVPVASQPAEPSEPQQQQQQQQQQPAAERPRQPATPQVPQAKASAVAQRETSPIRRSIRERRQAPPVFPDISSPKRAPKRASSDEEEEDEEDDRRVTRSKRTAPPPVAPAKRSAPSPVPAPRSSPKKPAPASSESSHAGAPIAQVAGSLARHFDAEHLVAVLNYIAASKNEWLGAWSTLNFARFSYIPIQEWQRLGHGLSQAGVISFDESLQATRCQLPATVAEIAAHIAEAAQPPTPRRRDLFGVDRRADYAQDAWSARDYFRY